jgi:hypothetical protein
MKTSLLGIVLLSAVASAQNCAQIKSCAGAPEVCSWLLGEWVPSLECGGVGAAVSLVDHCVATNTGTCTINSTGANLIVVAVVAGGLSTTTAPTENNGNTFQTPAAAGCVVGTNRGATQIYYIFSPTVGSSHIFTGHASGNIYFVSAWSGVLTGSGVYDTGNSRCTLGGAGTAYTTGSVTPSSANELLVSVALNDDTSTAFTLPTNFTQIDTSTSWGQEKAAYYVYPSTSATNPSWTNTAQPDGGAAIAVFKHP